jgi:LPXTG-motif cell wall-anchored protein
MAMSTLITSHRRGRFGVRLAVVSLGLAGLGVATTAGTSAAHTGNVTPSCTGLRLNLNSYEGPATNNTVTVTIDGTARVISFGSGLDQTFKWSDAENHTWAVVIDANLEKKFDTTKWDWSDGGTELACVTTTTTTTAPPTTTTTTAPPTTTTAPPTTTTAPPTTTTTAPPTTTTTTVTPTTVTPTTVTPTTVSPTTVSPTTVTPTTVTPTTDISTTTAVVATGVPPVPPAAKPTAVDAASGGVSAAPTAPSGSILPSTGSNTGLQVALAVAFLLAGVGMITITRRRPRSVDR